MEFASGRSGHGDGSESSGADDEVRLKEETVEVPPLATTERSTGKTTVITASTKKEDVNELESAKAQMGAVREENQRLKMSLDRIMKDYQTLQMQFHQIVKQGPDRSADKANHHNHLELTEESELVSLSLGRVKSNPKSDEQTKVSRQLRDEEFKEELALGLDCKFGTSKSGGSTNETLPNGVSPTNSSDDAPKEEAGETPPSKVLKTVRDSGEDEVSQQNPAKKARVSVRARCDTPTMNDGCQWRKYGQKIAKGNPCPRAYYRCTVGPSCPVRKQVQRCAEDMSILITTYEGTHNHPLPLSATAMASTTSAAASMLLSGSSTSQPGGPIASTSTTAATDLHGLNFYLSDGSKPRQFYLSNPALSSSLSHPTITLDLTNPAPSSQFGRFTSNYNPPRYSSSSTSLNFSSSESNAISWGNGFLSYNSQPYDNNRNVLSNINLGYGRQLPMENIYQSYMQKNNNINPSQHPLPETIAAATKAITADPAFQSALAAALTSIIGTGNGGNQGIDQGVVENLAQKMVFPASASSTPLSLATTTNSKFNGCASSFLNKTSTNAVQTGSLMFRPPPLPFSSPKSASASPGDNRESTN